MAATVVVLYLGKVLEVITFPDFSRGTIAKV